MRRAASGDDPARGCAQLHGTIVLLALVLPALLYATREAAAQELEPRLLTNVPVGMNFGVIGYAYSRGNILLDPAVPVEDLDSKLHTFVAAYVRSIDVGGLASKVDVVVPFAAGDWKGRLEGQDTARSVTGFGDPRIRLSVAFVGAPALEAEDFGTYQQTTIVGASVQVIAPLGQYDSSKLLNLGSNRWTIRSVVGASHATGPWTLELYGGAWLFGKNSDFFGGSTVTQKPLVVGKTHVIYRFPRGRWLAFDLGYGIGGRSTIDDDVRDTRISTFRFGLTLAFPMGSAHTLRLVAASGARVERGPDFDALGTTYQYRWGGLP
jgi:hypothetical protein